MGRDSWHSLPVADVALRLSTDLVKGLTPNEVRQRLSIYGYNEIRVKKRGPLLMFLRQFANILIALLLAATVIAAVMGEVVESVAIVVIVLIMCTMGFVQEFKAEKTIEALKRLAAPRAVVVRGGLEVEVPSTELVPGDIIVLREGDYVPADVRLVEAHELEVDESPLTGESTPVEKDPSILLPEDTPVSERRNMVFMGTYIVRGRGKGIVVSTGTNTELGKIARAVALMKEEKSPLERELDYFAKRIGVMVIAISVIVFIAAMLEGFVDVLEAAMIAMSLAVAAVPEGLPAVATAILAVGAYRMAKRNALVRRLAAVESLGSIDIMCVDKTGTITKGEMTVKTVNALNGYCEVEGSGYEPKGRVTCSEENDFVMLFKLLAAHTSTDAKLVEEGGQWKVRGSPTEGAALVLAYKGLGAEGVERALNELEVIKVYPFDRFRKRKSTVHRYGDGYIVVVTGAPEMLLEVTSRVRVNGKEVPLTDELRGQLINMIEGLARSGYRTLGVAYRSMQNFDNAIDVSEVERDLVFYAVLGIIDPPREGVAEAVRVAKRAGVKTIMVTGDHRLTAVAIARMIELDVDEEKVLEGRDLDRLSDDELIKIVDKVTVYARVTPEHKARIVKLLKAKGYRVAMTGDGVNDAPALKVADVGVAMGVRGTEVAKEASQLVLLDDNYATMVEAVREGRVIWENLKKPINYLLTANMGEVATIFGSQLLFWPPPLRPIHLLWVNVVTDALPAAALGFEPPEPGIMERPPRGPHERIVTGRKVVYYAVMGGLLALCVLLVYGKALGGAELPLAQTVAFAALSISEFGRALACRSERLPSWRLPRNKWLWPSIIISAALMLLAIYTPLNTWFKSVPIEPAMWPYLLLPAAVVYAVDELRKILNIKI